MARPKGPEKIRINITMTEDTRARLEQYAYENHTTMSQAITDWVWKAKVKNEQIPGQISIGKAGK